MLGPKQPHWVRMLCKGRLLQLELFEEVNPDQSNAQRSHTTGHLVSQNVHARTSFCQLLLSGLTGSLNL
jgi:hypothetical protein